MQKERCIPAIASAVIDLRLLFQQNFRIRTSTHDATDAMKSSNQCTCYSPVRSTRPSGVFKGGRFLLLVRPSFDIYLASSVLEHFFTGSYHVWPFSLVSLPHRFGWAYSRSSKNLECARRCNAISGGGLFTCERVSVFKHVKCGRWVGNATFSSSLPLFMFPKSVARYATLCSCTHGEE